MIDGRKLAMQKGGLRKSTLWKEAKDYVLGFQSGQTWSRKIGETTARKYYIELYRICDELGKNPDELLETKFKAMKEANTPLEARQCENMLEDLLYKMIKEGQSPLMTKHALVSFFKHNDFPLMPSFASEIEQREKPAEEYNIIQNPDEVVKIEQYLNYERDVAVLWFLESTGIRRGSLKHLKFGHLYEIRHIGDETRFYNLFDEDKEGDLDRLVPLMLDIPAEYLKGKGRGKYKGVRQVTFVHFHAYRKLMNYVEWLKKLKRYVYDEKGKRRVGQVGVEFKTDTPLFISLRLKQGKIKAIHPSSFYKVLTNALVLAKGNGLPKLTPHDFKRFVETSLMRGICAGELPTEEIPQQKFIDIIVAHKPKARDRAYLHPPREDLLRIYKMAVAYLVPEVNRIEAERRFKPIDQIKPFPAVEIPESQATRLLYMRMMELENEIQRLKKQRKS